MAGFSISIQRKRNIMPDAGIAEIIENLSIKHLNNNY